MGHKKKQHGWPRDSRVNLKFRTEEEEALYFEMKARAAKRGLRLHDFILDLFRKEKDRPL